MDVGTCDLWQEHLVVAEDVNWVGNAFLPGLDIAVDSNQNCHVFWHDKEEGEVSRIYHRIYGSSMEQWLNEEPNLVYTSSEPVSVYLSNDNVPTESPSWTQNNPVVTGTADGRVVLAWTRTNHELSFWSPPPEIPYLTTVVFSIWEDGVWSEPFEPFPDLERLDKPALAASTEGGFWLVVSGWVSGDTRKIWAYREKPDAGVEYHGPFDADGYDSEPAIAFDSFNRLWLSWLTYGFAPCCARYFYTSFQNDVWSEINEIPLVSDDLVNPDIFWYFSWSPAIQVAASEGLWVLLRGNDTNPGDLTWNWLSNLDVLESEIWSPFAGLDSYHAAIETNKLRRLQLAQPVLHVDPDTQTITEPAQLMVREELSPGGQWLDKAQITTGDNFIIQPVMSRSVVPDRVWLAWMGFEFPSVSEDLTEGAEHATIYLIRENSVSE